MATINWVVKNSDGTVRTLKDGFDMARKIARETGLGHHQLLDCICDRARTNGHDVSYFQDIMFYGGDFLRGFDNISEMTAFVAQHYLTGDGWRVS